MIFDFSQFFQQYESIVQEVDKIFAGLQSKYPEQVRCSVGCCDCCYALFDLTLIEAMYINQKFNESLSENQRQAILKEADKRDRQTYKIKYQAYKSRQKGEETNKILQDIGKHRVRCPLLNDNNRCILYEFRPINCRVYGLPVSTGGEVHVCSLSGFEPGGKYPTLHMDKIQDRLFQISQNLVQSIPTKHVKMAEVLVPLSMALLTVYDQEYLGILNEQDLGMDKNINEQSAGGQGGT